MKSLYPKSGKTLKKVVRVLNIIGYAVGDLCGIFVGLLVGSFIRVLGGSTILVVGGGLAAAGLTAALILFMVWFAGLVLWTISDAADDAKAVREIAAC